MIIWVICALLVGAVGGGFVVRQRFRAKEVVGAINGVPIKDYTLYHYLEKSTGRAVMEQLVQDELALQFAKKKGVPPSDAEVDKRYDKQAKGRDFDLRIANIGWTPEDVRRLLRVRVAQANVVKQGVSVTDAEVRGYYNANINHGNATAQYYTPESVQVAAIVTGKETKARQALRDLNDGVRFDTVVNKYSEDTSRKTGGVLPPVFHGRANLSKLPGLEQTIFAMKIGQQIGPRKFGGAWWVIRCLDHKPETTQPFDSVKDECRDAATLAKGLRLNTARINSEFDEFKKHSTIQMFWDQYKGVVSK